MNKYVEDRLDQITYEMSQIADKKMQVFQEAIDLIGPDGYICLHMKEYGEATKHLRAKLNQLAKWEADLLREVLSMPSSDVHGNIREMAIIQLETMYIA